MVSLCCESERPRRYTQDSPAENPYWVLNNTGRDGVPALLTLPLKDHFACVGGLFRPIRPQHNWMMTTSFTCSTGLGDKLSPLLLSRNVPAAVCMTPEREREGERERERRREREREGESRVSQMMTSGIKAPRGAVLSPVQSAATGGGCARRPCGEPR